MKLKIRYKLNSDLSIQYIHDNIEDSIKNKAETRLYLYTWIDATDFRLFSHIWGHNDLVERDIPLFYEILKTHGWELEVNGEPYPRIAAELNRKLEPEL